jgi:hypothetical protein
LKSQGVSASKGLANKRAPTSTVMYVILRSPWDA